MVEVASAPMPSAPCEQVADVKEPIDLSQIPGPGPITGHRFSNDPDMVIWEGFISQEEAQHIMRLAEGRWKRSTVSTGKSSDLLYKPLRDGPRDDEQPDDPDRPPDADVTPDKIYVGKSQVGVEAISPNRTSFSCFLDPTMEDEIILRIAARVATVTGVPLDNVEDLVLVRYEEGQVFKQHHDGAGRPKTVFVYLNEVAAGGETSFPHLGYKVAPSACTAVMWNNTIHSEDGTELPDMRMVHEALAPGPGCIKYGMNCFVNKVAQRDCSHIAMVPV
mmetsp:Transcript_49135/g.114918  ORF Transcript_49135/g.114918 Transcript_49135/m.114918 type:complete len:276 (+) Transcript_49135:32-859(+)